MWNPEDEVIALNRRLAETKKRLAEIEEREAAVCPEDVPFDEYIRSLQGQLEAARKGSPLYVNEANVLRAHDVEDCPDFTLPAHFTFDPHNKEEQAEIQRRARLHMQTCGRCASATHVTNDREPEEIERDRLEREVVKAAKLWRTHPIGANKFELERAVEELKEHETQHRQIIGLYWRSHSQ